MEELIERLAKIEWTNSQGLVTYKAMRESREIISCLQNEWNKLAVANEYAELITGFDVDKFIEIAIDTCGLDYKKALGTCRKREYVDFRFACISVVRERSRYSLSRIGRRFNRDHTTIIHAIESHNNLVVTDDSYRSMYNNIVAAWDNYVKEKNQLADETPHP